MISDNLKNVLDEKLWNSANKLISYYERKGYKVRKAI